MSRTQNKTQFYIRTTKSECFYVESLKEALEQFASDEGYRLTLFSGGTEVVMRRDNKPQSGLLVLEGEKTYNSTVTIRKPVVRRLSDVK